MQNIAIVFDASTFAIFGSLLNGLTLYPIQKNQLLDFSYLEKYIKENKINIINLTVSFFNKLIEYNPKIFEESRVILIGGEEVLPKTVNIFRKNNPQVEIVNVYGPTENSNLSCCHIIKQDYKKSVPIGIPVSNSTCYILDKNQNVLPAKIPGEIYVGGDGVALGYLNNPELTNEKFIPNPFGEGKLYKTGDLGYWQSNGAIQFSGRIDFQVKIRGFRIELKEIESKILEYGNIQECAVFTLGNDASKILVACIASKNNINTRELNSYLKTKLPHYMVPVKYICMESLPLNINGKLDTKLLKASIKEDVTKEIISSRNEIDHVIIHLLNGLFSNANISITDSFFDLGGDSLSAISFASKLSKEFGTNITVQDIFKHTMVKDLSDYISTLAENIYQNVIEKIEKRADYPISSAQKRIYYASNLDKDSTLYNIAGGIVVDQTLDIKKLEECFRVLIARHEALRTRFEMKDDNVIQIIEDNINFHLELEHSSTENLNEIYSNFVKPFDLSKAPLFRTKLVHLKNNKTLLLLDMHHIISDGSSLSILLQELCDLYNGSTLSEKQIDYKDFTLWEKEQFETEAFKKSKEFWVNQYKDEIPLLNMPTPYTRPSVQSFEGSNYNTKLPKEVFEKVNEIAKKLNITPYMLLLAVYYILLSKYTSQDDIVVGSPIVGRELPELSNVLGMFVNTLALRNKVDHSSTFKDFSKAVKQNCLDSFENGNYPFDMLVKDLNITRDTSRNPLFDVMFVYQNNGYPKINLQNANVEYFIPENNVSKFDLTLEVTPMENEYSLRFEYCTKLFDKDFIQRFALHYINILTAILENNEIKIADIDMLSEEERHQILYEFNDTTKTYSTYSNLITAFNETSKTYAHHIAVIQGDSYITYSELDFKSNCLAHMLLENGIQKGDIVGVCLNRSIELIVSIWAILKIGAIYMPMYVGYPLDRLNYMMNDSNASAIITNSNLVHMFNCNTEIIIDHLNDIKIFDLQQTYYNINILPDDTAYVIYTSGSTGRPKGVKISHKNLINFLSAFNNLYDGISIQDSFLASTNISFDVSIWELFLPILKGAKLILNNEEILTNIIDFCTLILDQKITSLYIPPNILNEVYEILKNSPNIKINKLLVGVEPIKKETLNKYFELNNDIKILNGYGPTETTICATVLEYKKDCNHISDYVSIGRPLCNNKIHILDTNLQYQPVGVVGEIYISGAGIGNGYLNNEEENHKHFVMVDNVLMYKTGDLAKWNNDGTINFIGRNDHQIKISGYRIELNEINSILMSYPNIIKSHTIVRKLHNQDHLISYYITESDITSKDLRAYLQSKLAFYMVPKYLIQIDSFPLTVNGKIDSNLLPNPKFTENKDFISPRNKLEKDIAKVWCKLLNLDKISIDDNFFELGCDSLIAIKFQLEIVKGEIDINYSDIFSYPTIRLLSDNKNKVKHTSFNFEDDYSSINRILSYNSKISPNEILQNKNNRVLLLGSTGFLGAHILNAYLSAYPDNVIYCVIRRKSFTDPKERLKKTLNYYFDDKYDYYFENNKIIVIEGDITQKNLSLSEDTLKSLMDNVDIIINSAALVKHYGDYDTFNKINIQGTINITNICNIYHKKLYHISTLSVSGFGLANVNNTMDSTTTFDETSLYVNQNLDNAYLYTKFEAEKYILSQIAIGLQATILRVGNLTNRFEDGVFQINVTENAFVNKIKSILSLGMIQDSFVGHSLEFTPVDFCAEAIITIIGCIHSFSVLHLFNTNLVTFENLIEYINSIGYNLDVVPNKLFSQHVLEYLNDDNLKENISGIITDLNKDRTLNYSSSVSISADLSNRFLHKLNFYWPNLDINYFRKFFNYFNKIKYFN